MRIRIGEKGSLGAPKEEKSLKGFLRTLMPIGGLVRRVDWRLLVIFRRSTMLGPIARWGHNVLLASMVLLTIAIVVLAK
jgi:hypothetical protein